MERNTTCSGRREWWVVVMVVWLCVPMVNAAPQEHLKAEHRDIPLSYNLLENIPSVSDHSFVWRANNGAYRFGLKTPDQWRVESRDAGGAVQGQYFYRTPDGGEVNMRYNAGATRPLPDTAANQRQAPQSSDRVGGNTQLLSAVSDPHQEVFGGYLHQQEEELMPYGALRVAGDDLHRLRAETLSTEHHEDLQAIVTDIRQHAP